MEENREMDNLPPGVSVNDIPGNRPEDERWEMAHAFLDFLMDNHKVSPEEALGYLDAAFQDGDYAESAFINYFNVMSERVYSTAVEKGFWDNDRNEGEMIALIHSELSEALEAIRNGNPPDDKIPDFNGVEAELADVIIRIMDMAQGLRYRVAFAIIAKMRMNKDRKHKSMEVRNSNDRL